MGVGMEMRIVNIDGSDLEPEPLTVDEKIRLAELAKLKVTNSFGKETSSPAVWRACAIMTDTLSLIYAVLREMDDRQFVRWLTLMYHEITGDTSIREMRLYSAAQLREMLAMPFPIVVRRIFEVVEAAR